MLVKIMLAKIFEKNLELSSCWFSTWNVHMWSLLQLSSQHMFLAETFSSRWDIFSTCILCRKSCFTVNIFFVLPEKNISALRISTPVPPWLDPSPRLLPLFFFLLFCGCLFFVTGKSQHRADFRPTERRFFQFRQSYSFHIYKEIYKVLLPYGVMYKYETKRNIRDQLI